MQKKSPRHLARSLAIQGVYHHKLNQNSIIEIEHYLANSETGIYPKANYDLMHYLLEQSINQFKAMLERYQPYLQRELHDINLIEQIILVIAAIELINNLNVPAAVVINEAVELAKLYGAGESYKFINGLVDKLANETRADEIKHSAKAR
jgi:N utilization substance protein B